MSTSYTQKSDLKDYIDFYFKNSKVIALLHEKLESPSLDLETFKSDLEKIKTVVKIVLQDSFQMPFSWQSLKDEVADRIVEDFVESSQGLYFHADYEYGNTLPFIISLDRIPSLYQIAILYRHPICYDHVNAGFLMELKLHENLDEVIEKLVAHSYGYSTWQYVDQEYEFRNISELDEDSKNTYESIAFEHKSISKAHEDIVFKNYED